MPCINKRLSPYYFGAILLYPLAVVIRRIARLLEIKWKRLLTQVCTGANAIISHLEFELVTRIFAMVPLERRRNVRFHRELSLWRSQMPSRDRSWRGFSIGASIVRVSRQGSNLITFLWIIASRDNEATANYKPRCNETIPIETYLYDKLNFIVIGAENRYRTLGHKKNSENSQQRNHSVRTVSYDVTCASTVYKENSFLPR